MSQDELVDIIDENFNVLYTTTKRQAHERGLLHKTTVAQVFDSKGNWLLIKQASDRQDAGQYVCPVGGHVMAGEKDQDAIKRETKEELGFAGDFDCELLGSKIYNRTVLGRQENHMYIMYKIVCDQIPIINEESESYKYFTKEELRREIKDNPKQFGDAFRFASLSFFPELL